MLSSLNSRTICSTLSLTNPTKHILHFPSDESSGKGRRRVRLDARFRGTEARHLPSKATKHVKLRGIEGLVPMLTFPRLRLAMLY